MGQLLPRRTLGIQAAVCQFPLDRLVGKSCVIEDIEKFFVSDNPHSLKNGSSSFAFCGALGTKARPCGHRRGPSEGCQPAACVVVDNGPSQFLGIEPKSSQEPNDKNDRGRPKRNLPRNASCHGRDRRNTPGERVHLRDNHALVPLMTKVPCPVS